MASSVDCLFCVVKAEEEALMYQQYVAGGDSVEFEAKLRPYMSRIRMVIMYSSLFFELF